MVGRFLHHRCVIDFRFSSNRWFRFEVAHYFSGGRGGALDRLGDPATCLSGRIYPFRAQGSLLHLFRARQRQTCGGGTGQYVDRNGRYRRSVFGNRDLSRILVFNPSLPGRLYSLYDGARDHAVAVTRVLCVSVCGFNVKANIPDPVKVDKPRYGLGLSALVTANLWRINRVNIDGVLCDGSYGRYSGRESNSHELPFDGASQHPCQNLGNRQLGTLGYGSARHLPRALLHVIDDLGTPVSFRPSQPRRIL